MKSFIIKNRFFVSLLMIAVLIMLPLSIYIIQQKITASPIENPNNDLPIEDPNKETEITAFSGSYNRLSNENKLTISWEYVEYNTKVDTAYLYLNDNEGINVTQNRYYEFVQNVYDFPTGDNQIRLVLNLNNGKKVEKEIRVFVNYIISVKQEVVLNNNVVNLTLEYVYDTARFVSPPKILTAAAPDIVTYIDTQTSLNGNKTIARTTFAFTWNNMKDIPSKWSVRWMFNEIPDSFDLNVTKPVTKTTE